MLAMTPDGLQALRAAPWLDPIPTVGDWLAVRRAPEDPNDIQVERVLERTSLLRRMTADGTGSQALAANVELVLIACGLDRPVRAGRIHRAAAQAWDADARPVLLLTKAGAPGATDVDLPRLELEHPGMRVLVTSSQEGVGLDDVRALVDRHTAVLVGESGAGKSTLINALLGREEAATGAVREGDSKGRHTTSSRQLHLLPGSEGGCIIDTPGIRSLGLFADAESVDAAFADTRSWQWSAGSATAGTTPSPGVPCARHASRASSTQGGMTPGVGCRRRSRVRRSARHPTSCASTAGGSGGRPRRGLR
jgi:ribosome biogenesis GTPase